VIDPGRKLAQLGIERAEMRVRAQERFLGEIGDVGRRPDAGRDEIRNPALVTIHKHAEILAIPS
jgi:hypothetical protein